MPSTRRNPSPSEAGSEPDTIGNVLKRTNYSDVARAVEKLKAQRAEARNTISRVHKEELATIKSRIENSHHARRETLSTLKSDTLHRLFKAIEKRNACEEAILDQIKTLRKDRDHLFLLVDAVYEARVDSAKNLQIE